MHINDILNKQGSFMSHTDISAKYNVKCTFLSILQIRQSIPLKWRSMLWELNNNDNLQIEKEFFLLKEDVVKPLRYSRCNDLYWICVYKKGKACIKKWYDIYPDMMHGENIWTDLSKLPFRICRETQLQSFQSRVLHRIIPCRIWLTNIKV